MDKALFGELTFDITDKLSVTGGIRFFESDNSLKGFFGYGAGYSSQDRRGAVLRPATAFRTRALHQPRQDGEARTATPSASTSPTTSPTT